MDPRAVATNAVSRGTRVVGPTPLAVSQQQRKSVTLWGVCRGDPVKNFSTKNGPGRPFIGHSVTLRLLRCLVEMSFLQCRKDLTLTINYLVP